MGKGLPLPVDLPWQLQILFWGLMLLLTVVFGLVVWFLVRYVKGQDDQNIKIDSTLSGLKTSMVGLETKVKDGQIEIAKEAVKLREASTEFQQGIHKEVLEIRKEVLTIEKSLSQTSAKAEQLDKTVTAMNGAVVQTSETVTAHQKSLSMGAQAMVKHRDKLTAVEEKVNKLETEHVQLAKDLILIRDKHKPGGSKT